MYPINLRFHPPVFSPQTPRGQGKGLGLRGAPHQWLLQQHHRGGDAVTRGVLKKKHGKTIGKS